MKFLLFTLRSNLNYPGLFWVLLAFVLLNSACNIQSPDSDCPPNCDPFTDTDSVEYIWHVPLSEMGAQGVSNFKPIIYNDLVIVDITEKDPDIHFINPAIVLLDKESGQKVRKLVPNGLTAIAYEYAIYENLLVVRYFRNDEYLICWDLDSGEKEWAMEETDLSDPYRPKRYISQLGNTVYLVECDLWTKDINLFQIDIQTGSYKPIFTFTDFPEYVESIRISDIESEINNIGDTIIYFSSEHNFESGTLHNQFLNAINVTKGDLEWSQLIDDFHQIHYGSPVLFNDMVMVCGGKSLVKACNKSDGQIIWQRQIDKINSSAITITRPLLTGNKMYVKTNDKALYCLNAENGGVVWEGFDHGERTSSELENHEGKLYYTCWDEYLYVVSMEDGQIIRKEKSPFVKYPHRQWNTVSVDSSTGLFYYFDSKHLVAGKVPE